MRHDFKSRINRIFRQLINPLPAKPPAYLQLQFQYSSQDRRKKKSYYQNINLLKNKTAIDLVVKISSGPSEQLQNEEWNYSIPTKTFERFYHRIRKWRLDRIRGPYEHRSYENYSEDWSEMLWIRYGKDEEEKNIKEIEVANTRDLGIDGKDLQKLNLVFLLLKRLER